MFLIVLAYIINLMTVVNKFAPLKPRKFWQLPKQLFFNHETSDWYQWEKRGLFGFSINGGRKKQRIKEIEKERKKEKRKKERKKKIDNLHSIFTLFLISNHDWQYFCGLFCFDQSLENEGYQLWHAKAREKASANPINKLSL